MRLDEVTDLEKRVRAEYEEKLRAIELVKGMLASDERTPANDGQAAGQVARLESKTRPQPSPQQAPPLIDAAYMVIHSLNKNWSTGDVVKELQFLDFPFESKTPASSVSTALMRLVDRGKVVRVQRGSGRRPSLYRAAEYEIPVEERENPEVSAPGPTNVTSDDKQETTNAAALAE